MHRTYWGIELSSLLTVPQCLQKNPISDMSSISVWGLKTHFDRLLFLLHPCRMRAADEHSWKHAVRSDYSHQPVWSEPKREWCTHPVPAQPVPVSVCLCAEQHGCLSEHGEDWWPAGQPAGVGQQLNSFILAFKHVHWFAVYVFIDTIWNNCKM